MPQERHEPWEYQPWMKFYTKSWIMGSIRTDCFPEERSVFMDLLALANESRNRGIVQANETTPYSHDRLAEIINVSLELLERSLQKFEEQNRIHENNRGIVITNFTFYNPPVNKTGVRGRPRKVPEEQLPLEPVPQWAGKPDPKAAELWEKALKTIEGQSSKANFRTWLQKTVGLSYKGSKFVIGAPNSYTAEHLMQSQLGLMGKAVSELTGGQVDVEVLVYTSEE